MKSIDSNQSCDCEAITQATLVSMKADGYSCKNESYIYRSLILFCQDRYEGIYSAEAGNVFLIEKNKTIQSDGQKAVYRNSILRLNSALIGEFHWKPKRPIKPYQKSCYDEIVQSYENYLKQTKKTNNDIRYHVRIAADFLFEAQEQGVEELLSLTPAVIYAAFEKAGSKENFRKIKPFFRYAYNYGFCEEDFSVYVPTVSRHKPVPTVYTLPEINTLLQSVDRSTEIGKRNYSILLLAARYGIRSSDIASITLSDIDLDKKVLHVIQKKTGVPIEFPLTDEVIDALLDYITSARPDNKQPVVFLGFSKPYATPLSTQGIHHIVSKYFSLSGINTHGKHCGAHALRSSLATQLLNEGVGYHEIQQILGHTSPDAATHYIRVETEKLRECALRVPPLGNPILSYLEGRIES